MPTTPSRSTRSSVLGKRAHQSEQSATSACDQLQTPDTTPSFKRMKTSGTVLDGDHNKENIPPFNLDPLESSPISPRATRALRRTSADATITPPRPSTASLRRASTSTLIPPKTPTVEISKLAIATPPATPPATSLPIHLRAKNLLRATSNSVTTMPGRDAERDTIRRFITSFIAGQECNDAAKSLYISGSPGTGKTALVHSILHHFDLAASDIKPVVINCMALNSVDMLCDRLTDELEGANSRKAGPKGKKTKVASQTKCLVVLDELDHIVSSTQALNTIFSFSPSNASMFRIIGIANTHTLSAKSTPSTSTGVQTLHFAPYTSTQLAQILESRLASLRKELPEAAKKLFLPAALVLLTKKVAGMTGDVRSLFEILRGAIDLAAASAAEGQVPAVSPAHVLTALKAYAPAPAKTAGGSAGGSSEVVTKIRSLGLQARMALLSVVLGTNRVEADLPLLATSSPVSPIKRSSSSTSCTGKCGIDPNLLHAYYQAVLNRADSDMLAALSRSEFGDLINMLEGVGLVSVSSNLHVPSSPTKAKRTFGRTTSFGGSPSKTGSPADIKLSADVLVDEVLRGLGVGPNADSASVDVLQEEVQAIWSREQLRVKKDVEIAQAKANKSNPSKFSDAMED